jgi:hypothetical protein
MRNRLVCGLSAIALSAGLMSSGSGAAEATMVELAEKLYRNASPESFDRQCNGSGAKLAVAENRHTCSKQQLTTIVRFEGNRATNATVVKKGLHKEVVGQLKRKLGAPDSVKTLGAMKMHFWFTEDASVSVGLQSSTKSRSTMVSFRSPS